MNCGGAVLRASYGAAVESVGYKVTAPEDFRTVLATHRSTHHSVVVVYRRTGMLSRLAPGEVQTLTANMDAPRCHQYVALGGSATDDVSPSLAALEHFLSVRWLLLLPYDV
jgi:hypothetical protein